MLFNSYSYEILYEQFHSIYLREDIKLLLVTVNNRLKFEIKIVHDLSCHPIALQCKLRCTQWTSTDRHEWHLPQSGARQLTHLLHRVVRTLCIGFLFDSSAFCWHWFGDGAVDDDSSAAFPPAVRGTASLSLRDDNAWFPVMAVADTPAVCRPLPATCLLTSLSDVLSSPSDCSAHRSKNYQQNMS